MLFSIEAYIKDNIKNPTYSEPRFSTGVTVGANTVINELFANQNVKYIFIYEISFSLPAVAGTYILTDNFNKIIMQYVVTATQAKQLSLFFHLIEANRLLLTFNTITIGISFTVGYQLVYDK